MKIIETLGEILGIGPREKNKNAGGQEMNANQLATERTDLALERNYMAAERTLMAWIRTALSMISFGFTIGKLGEALGSVSVQLAFGRTAGIEGVAYMLVVLGIVSLLAGVVQNRIEVVALFRAGLRRQLSVAFVVAILLILLGMFAFTALVIKL